MNSKRTSLIVGIVLILGAIYFFVSISNFNFLLTLALLIVGVATLTFGLQKN